jgi:hypothetical protein
MEQTRPFDAGVAEAALASQTETVAGGPLQQLRAVQRQSSLPDATLMGVAEQQTSLGAMCGRLRVGKKNLHFAALVGAAMCSACLRGTHDRWP